MDLMEAGATASSRPRLASEDQDEEKEAGAGEDKDEEKEAGAGH